MTKSLCLRLLFLLLSLSINGCSGGQTGFDLDTIKSWTEPQPQNYDEFMVAANNAIANNDPDKAIDLYERAMKSVEDEYGPYDMRIANVALYAGILQAKRDRYRDAEVYYKRALSIEKKILPANSPDLIKTKRSLADVLRRNFKPDEAKEVLLGVESSVTKRKRHR